MSLRSLFTPKWQQATVEQDLPVPDRNQDPIGFQVAIAMRPKKLKGESNESYAQALRAWELAQKGQ